MLTTIRSNLIARLRGFHQDEDGNVTMETAVIGAVGVCLAAVLFSTISSAIQGGGNAASGGSGLGSIIGSLIPKVISKVGGLLGF
jgi:hypothetical protein